MASKRPSNYKPMDLSLKFEILHRLRKGESASKLAEIYKIPRTSINDIKKNGDKIKNFMSKMEITDGDVTKRIRLTPAANTDLDEAMYLWLVQQRSLGVPLSGPILIQKALEMNAKMNGNPEFKASVGWLGKFKQRHGIRQLSIEEVINADSECVKSYCEKLISQISNLGLSREQVYNCDESGLYWKALPTSGSETSAPGYKMRKERLTIMVCSNASGNHKLPLTVIGKATKPKALKNFNRNLLPVNYYAQKNARINQEIFTAWFHNVFVVQVKSYLKSKNLPEKALLIVDNAPAHPLNELEGDQAMKCFFLPVNTTSLIQPMDQGVIESLKRRYRKILIQNFISCDMGSNLDKFWKQYTIKHAIFNIDDAWNNVPNETLSRSWNKIWPSDALNGGNSDENKQLMDDVYRMCEDTFQIEQDDVNDWLNVDNSDLGYEILNDNEIIERVTNKDVNNQEGDDDDNDEDDISNSRTVHCKEVEEMLSKCIEWYEQQNEAEISKLIAMRQVRNLAITKGREKLVQKKITQFFRN